MTAIPFTVFLDNARQRINTVLSECLASQATPDSELHTAMCYATLDGGKRVRPLLAYATAEAVGAVNENTDRVAAAVELSHAYSLVHDDLPAMDDDDLRRGKPTCHKAFNEALAILTGDALQALAFGQLSEISTTQPGTLPRLLSTLASAIGAAGMVGGQAFDIAAVNNHLSVTALERMHRGKTGALINASILMSAIATEQVTEQQMQALTLYGNALGLAFQVKDDILDVESDTKTLGKTQGADNRQNKPTYTSILGIESAKTKAEQLHQQAIHALTEFGREADVLREIAHYIVKRRY